MLCGSQRILGITLDPLFLLLGRLCVCVCVSVGRVYGGWGVLSGLIITTKCLMKEWLLQQMEWRASSGHIRPVQGKMRKGSRGGGEEGLGGSNIKGTACVY